MGMSPTQNLADWGQRTLTLLVFEPKSWQASTAATIPWQKYWLERNITPLLGTEPRTTVLVCQCNSGLIFPQWVSFSSKWGYWFSHLHTWFRTQLQLQAALLKCVLHPKHAETMTVNQIFVHLNDTDLRSTSIKKNDTPEKTDNRRQQKKKKIYHCTTVKVHMQSVNTQTDIRTWSQHGIKHTSFWCAEWSNNC